MNCKRHLDVHQSRSRAPPTPRVTHEPRGHGRGRRRHEDEHRASGRRQPHRDAARAAAAARHADDVEHALATCSRDRSRTAWSSTRSGATSAPASSSSRRAPEPDAVQTAAAVLQVGAGPEYLVFNPYTLVQFEMPRSIAEVGARPRSAVEPGPAARRRRRRRREARPRPGDGSTASAAMPLRTDRHGQAAPGSCRWLHRHARSCAGRGGRSGDARRCRDRRTAPIVRCAAAGRALGATV